jgi:hypothetical protein
MVGSGSCRWWLWLGELVPPGVPSAVQHAITRRVRGRIGGVGVIVLLLPNMATCMDQQQQAPRPRSADVVVIAGLYILVLLGPRVLRWWRWSRRLCR